MIKWFAKKYVLSLVNTFIKKLNSKCDVEAYRTRIMAILKYLNNLLEVLDDGEVTGEEADKIIDATKQLF